jgi:serine phosphatase RsbU (regulator of sigma subunit)
MESLDISTVEMGLASLPFPGQSHSGDSHLVKSFSNGVLVAALDGLGHGEEAAMASKLARKILEDHAEEPLIAAVRQCHEALRATRGVVMSVASFNIRHHLMTWLGVGNLQGVLIRGASAVPPAEETLLLRAGVVGGHLPPLQASVLSVSGGDTLVFTTDGIDVGFPHEMVRNQPPQKAAEWIMATHFRATDDALVLIVRYLGAGHARH